MSDPPIPEANSNDPRKPTVTQSTARRGTRFFFESKPPVPAEDDSVDAPATAPDATGEPSVEPSAPSIPIGKGDEADLPAIDDSAPTRILSASGLATQKLNPPGMVTQKLPELEAGCAPVESSRPTVMKKRDIARLPAENASGQVTRVGTTQPPAPTGASPTGEDDLSKEHDRHLIFGHLKDRPGSGNRPASPGSSNAIPVTGSGNRIPVPASGIPGSGSRANVPGSGARPNAHGSGERPKVQDAAVKPPAKPAGGLATAQHESGSYFGDFQLVKALTAGGFGDVWIAVDTTTSKEVVLKRLKPEQAEFKRAFYQFDIEIEIGQRVKHPNLVPVLQSGIVDGRRFFTMPRITGPSLTRILQKKAGADWVLTEQEILAALEMVGRALGFLHRAGVIHCDLKPDNILFAARNKPMLIDLGIAHTVNWQQTGYRALKGFREDKSILGTPEYMAPEMFLGESEQIGIGADIYAMGVMLYEVLCGVPPFKRDTQAQNNEGTKALMDLMERVQKAAPREILAIQPKASPALAELAMKCLSKDPASRPKSADDFAVAIGRVLRPSALPVATSKPSALGVLGKMLRKPGKPKPE